MYSQRILPAILLLTFPQPYQLKSITKEIDYEETYNFDKFDEIYDRKQIGDVNVKFGVDGINVFWQPDQSIPGRKVLNGVLDVGMYILGLSTKRRRPINEEENDDYSQLDDFLETTVRDKEEETTVTNKEEETTVTKKEKETTVINKKEETTIRNKEEETAVTNKEEETTVTNKEEETTVTNKKEETTVRNKEEETTVTNKEEETTVLNEEEENKIETTESAETTLYTSKLE